MAKVGRPKIQINEELLDKLCGIQCTDEEMASMLGCSVDTLTRNFADRIKKGKEKGRSSLRRMQYELAQKGNATMLIWLGKQVLGQKDRLEHGTDDNGFKIIIEDYKPKK